jgi:prolyl oligopeptidase
VPSPPPTRTDDIVDVIHGVDVPDPYRWLEDQDAPETRTWLNSQNAYTDSVLGGLTGRDALRATATRVLERDVIGLPNERGGRYFFEKRRADQDLSVLYVREGAAGENQVLLDPHPLSDDHTVSAEYSDIAADGTLLAYAVRTGGVDEVSIRLTNVDTREDLADALPTARYGGVWITPDKRGFFYERYGDVTPRVMFHELGTDIADDRMIFGEGYQVASDFCRGTVRRRTLAADTCDRRVVGTDRGARQRPLERQAVPDGCGRRCL